MKLIDRNLFVEELKKYEWEAPSDYKYLTRVKECLNNSEVKAIPIEWLEENYTDCPSVDLPTVVERWKRENNN